MLRILAFSPAILIAFVGLINFSNSNLSDLTCSAKSNHEDISEDLHISEGGW
jgi:hypothetical protein